MKMIKMTGGQMMKNITKEMMVALKAASKRAPDTNDPDAPDLAESLAAGRAIRVGRPAKPDARKKLVAVRVDPDVYAAAKKYPGYAARVNDMMRGMFHAAGLL